MSLGKIRMSDFTGIYAPHKFHTTHKITSIQPKNSQFNSRKLHFKNDIVIVSKKKEYKSILAIELAV